MKLRRGTKFGGKCSVDLATLSDHEVLEKKGGEESIHTELRELIDKVSSFEKFVLPCGVAAGKLRAEVIEMRSSCMNDMRIFLDDVEDAIKKRDISAGLKIEMQKFEGYIPQWIYTPSVASFENGLSLMFRWVYGLII